MLRPTVALVSPASVPETHDLHCQVMRNAGEGFRVASLAGPLGSLFRSIALGVAAGALIGRVISLPARPFNWALRRLPQAAGGRVKASAPGASDGQLWASRLQQRAHHFLCTAKHRRCVLQSARMQTGPDWLHGALQAVARTTAVVGMAVAVFWAAERFAAEPLLACVLAGVIATNRKYTCARNAKRSSRDVP